jgi:hypothetical protein
MSVRYLRPIAIILVTGAVACSSPTASDGTVVIIQKAAPVPSVNAGAITTQPSGTGVAAATVLTFVVAPSGGVPPYTVAWTFGDGGAGAGTTAAHTYMSPGTFTATAMVTDSKGSSAQASSSVSIANVTGSWNLDYGGTPLTLDLVQDLTAVTATLNATNDGFASGTGSVSNPKSLAVSATFADALPAPFALTFTGKLNDTVTSWSGTMTGLSRCPCSFTATRVTAPMAVKSSQGR